MTHLTSRGSGVRPGQQDRPGGLHRVSRPERRSVHRGRTGCRDVRHWSEDRGRNQTLSGLGRDRHGGGGKNPFRQSPPLEVVRRGGYTASRRIRKILGTGGSVRANGTRHNSFVCRNKRNEFISLCNLHEKGPRCVGTGKCFFYTSLYVCGSGCAYVGLACTCVYPVLGVCDFVRG